MTDTAEGELAREQHYVSGLYERLDALRAETLDELDAYRVAGLERVEETAKRS